MGWLIGSILFGVMVIISIPQAIKNPKDNAFPVILMAVLSIVLFKKYINSKNGVTERKKEEKRIKEEEKKEKAKTIPGSKEKIEELGASLCINVKHMAGLPIAKGSPTFIYLCDNKIIFERNEATYNLYLEKIKDITIKTDVDIQKAYVSSIGGAIGGAVIFGPLGAMVGGRAKEKQSKTISNYLIFSYDKDNSIDFISFDVTGVFKAHKFVEFFKKIPKERKVIDL